MGPGAVATMMMLVAFAPPAGSGTAADDYDALVGKARVALEDRRIDEARRLLEIAERQHPGTLLVAYYRAYCDYREERFDEAASGFARALGIDPGDGWSSYMLALSQAKAGNTGEARARLVRLKATHAGDEVGKVSTGTLGELDALERAAGGRWALAVDVGVFSDSNPAFRADSAGSGQTDAALSLLVRSEYALVSNRAQRLAVGLGAGESAYLMRVGPADWTTLSGWLGYRRSGDALAWLASYRFDFSLYAYDPFTSVHTLSTGLRVPEADWTMTAIDLEGMARFAHSPDYDYLVARGAGLEIGQELEGARGLRGRIGYALRFEKADPASFRQEEASVDSAGTGHLLTGVYRTDYSFFGHGPAAGARVSIVAGLSLEGAAELSWRSYPHDDRVVYASDGAVTAEWEKQRRDFRIYAEGTLEWAFRDRLALLLRAAYLRNASTLGEVATDPVDRNYERFMFGLWMRGALKPADL